MDISNNVDIGKVVSVGMLITSNIAMALALILDFMIEKGNVMNYVLPVAGGILAGGIVLYRHERDEKIKTIIGNGILLTYEMLFILTIVFSIFIYGEGKGPGYYAGYPLIYLSMFLLSKLKNEFTKKRTERSFWQAKRNLDFSDDGLSLSPSILAGLGGKDGELHDRKHGEHCNDHLEHSDDGGCSGIMVDVGVEIDEG